LDTATVAPPLVPDAVIDDLVLGTTNAPYRRSISAAELVAGLTSRASDNWMVHIATFFTDVRPELILQFAAYHGVSVDSLAAAYHGIRTRTGEASPALEAALERLALELDAGLKDDKYQPTADELAGIDRGLRAAAEGRFATEQEVETAFAKFRAR
jgi:predicted transcriptional regulator